MVEGGSVGVEFHIPGIDPRPDKPIRMGLRRNLTTQLPEDPWVMKVVLAALDQEDFQVPIEICQTSSYNAATGSTYNLWSAEGIPRAFGEEVTSAHDDIKLIWDRHRAGCKLYILARSMMLGFKVGRQ